MTFPRVLRPLLPALTLFLLAAPAAAQSTPVVVSSSDQGDPSRPVVRVQTNEPDMTVGLVTDRVLAAGGGHIASGVGWKEVCTAPCSVETTPGMQTLVFRSPDLLRFHELRLRPGLTDVYLDRGSPGLRTAGGVLTTLGIGSLFTGGIFWLFSALLKGTNTGTESKSRFSWAPALTLVGAGATAGGITMVYVGRIRIEENTPSPQARTDRGLMIHAGGAF